MATNPENFLADASKTALDTLEILGNSSLSNAEKLTTLSLDATRTGIDKQVEGTVALMQVRNFQDFLALQNTLTRPVLQNAINYYSKAYAIANESQQELQRLAEKGYSEFARSVNSIMEKAAQSAPVHSDVAVAAVKSVISAANSAYDKMSDAAQKASDIAKGSVQASTEATCKAMDKSSPSPATPTGTASKGRKKQA